MPNTLISPNMNMPVPVVGVDPGPDWANNVNSCLSILDSHNHSPGSGVQITPLGININADLNMNGNNLTFTRTVRFASQVVPLSAAPDIDCIYVSGVDLWYNDGNGNQVRITQSGSVTGAAGTITGLPSGTASVSYAGGTFTFQSATATPATLAVGPLVMGAQVPNPKTVTLAASAAQPANYSLTWPLAAPANNQILVSDGSGNLSWTTSGVLPLGSVIAVFPNLPGAYVPSTTTTADANGFVLCANGTISDVTSPMNGAHVPNINNSVFMMGSTVAASWPAAGSTGGNNSLVISHSHTFTSTTSAATSSHTHNFAHAHQVFYLNGSNFLAPSSPSASQGTWTTAGVSQFTTSQFYTGGSSGPTVPQSFLTSAAYSSGALNAPSGSLGSATTNGASAGTTIAGTTDAAGSGTDSRPAFVSAVYVMRIK